MSEHENPDASADLKPGPANPQAEGVAEPTPPGGPQRQDAASSDHRERDDRREGAETSAEGAAEGSTIPIEDEPSSQSPEAPRSDEISDPQTDPDSEGMQEENAESSLDQPSEG